MELGNLDYLPPLNPQIPVRLGLLRVRSPFRGMGIGKALLVQFIKDAGSGRIVTAEVVHNDTLDYFESLAPNPAGTRKMIVNLTDPQSIKDVPIARVLISGGIEVVKFRVVYNPKDPLSKAGAYLHKVSLKGVTR